MIKSRVTTTEDFTQALARAFADRFDGKVIETHWNIFEMRHITTPVENADWAFTEEHVAFIGGFEAGWLARAG